VDPGLIFTPKLANFGRRCQGKYSKRIKEDKKKIAQKVAKRSR
jgi:hypothetical protein